MDKFAALQTFVDVVEQEGFAPAARVRGRSRAAVNRLVLALEEELGVQLFNRTTRQVSTTSEGAAFYERVKDILAALQEAERDAGRSQDEISGLLRVNAPMSFGTMHLGAAVSDFMLEHPNLRIELSLNDRMVDLIEEGFDLAIRIAEPSEDTTFVDLRICPAPLVMCASPSYLARQGTPIHPKELRTLPCLHYGNLPSGTFWRLNGPQGRTNVRVNDILCSNNGDVLREAAVKGLGIALLPRFIVSDDLKAGRLVPILEEFTAPEPWLTALYPPTRHLSAKIRVFTDFLTERFGGRPVWEEVA
ncbi:MAG: LysR family transcriptional regulator [Pseudomonadota bacterium]